MNEGLKAGFTMRGTSNTPTSYVGDVTLYATHTPYLYKRGTEEWLRAGSVIPYSSKYTGSLKRLLNYCSINHQGEVLSSIVSFPRSMLIRYASGYYVGITTGGTAATNMDGWVRTNGDPSTTGTWAWTTSSSYLAPKTSTLTPDGQHFYVTGTYAANSVYYLAPGQVVPSGMVSCSGTLTGSDNNMLTSSNVDVYITDGPPGSATLGTTWGKCTVGQTTFSALTTSGVANLTSYLLDSIHWSVCANAVIVLSRKAGTNKNHLFTMSATGVLTEQVLPVALSDITLFSNNKLTLQSNQNRVANSPTVTVLALDNGNVLHTTNGTTYTLVNLVSEDGFAAPAGSTGFVTYDATNGYFVYAYQSTYQGAYGGLSLLYSKDGLTWNVVPKIYPKSSNILATGQLSAINAVNGKILILLGSYIIDVGTKIYSGTPDFIGVLQPFTGNNLTTNSELRSTMYTRIK